MVIAFYLATWYLATLLAGVIGFRLLTALNVPLSSAWPAGRIVGLVVTTLIVWWAGYLGLRDWLPVGAGLLVLGAVLAAATTDYRQLAWRRLAGEELVLVLACAAILLIRWSHPAIQGTEKPMDFGILNSVLRSGQFPPADFWLAGRNLSYYYWGQLTWTIPIELSRVPPEYAYNLIAATVGGLTFVLSRAVAASLGASPRAAWMSGFLNLLAGTPDGMRQLLARHSFQHVDLWQSSRQVTNAITEFPLFTTWLGDLHAHFLVLPVFLATIAVASSLHRNTGPVLAVVLVGVLFGVASSVNPWSSPVLLALITALAISPGARLPSRLSRGPALVLYLGTVCLVGWLCTAPFQLNFHPPFLGLGIVHAQTRTADLVLYAGTLLVPLVAFLCLGTDRGRDNAGTGTGVWIYAGAAVLIAAVSGHPTLVLLAAVLGPLACLPLRRRDGGHGDAVLIAAIGVGLLLVPEILYVKDLYGDSHHRMNTIFKSYFQAWVLLSLSVPLLLDTALRREVTRRLACGIMFLVSLPHLVAVLLHDHGSEGGLDGLAWMQRSDRRIVDFLRRQEAGAAILESVGPAYSDAGRISASSGSPAYLGWPGHEVVWRGKPIEKELARRERIVDAIFTSRDPHDIRALAGQEHIRFVVIGIRERRLYDDASLAAVERAGTVALRAGPATVVRLPW